MGAKKKAALLDESEGEELKKSDLIGSSNIGAAFQPVSVSAKGETMPDDDDDEPICAKCYREKDKTVKLSKGQERCPDCGVYLEWP